MINRLDTFEDSLPGKITICNGSAAASVFRTGSSTLSLHLQSHIGHVFIDFRCVVDAHERLNRITSRETIQEGFDDPRSDFSV